MPGFTTPLEPRRSLWEPFRQLNVNFRYPTERIIRFKPHEIRWLFGVAGVGADGGGARIGIASLSCSIAYFSYWNTQELLKEIFLILFILFISYGEAMGNRMGSWMGNWMGKGLR